jgi:hypothetical protein
LGDTSDVDGSEEVLSNPESHTFGLPVLGGAGSLLPRRAGMHALTLEGGTVVGFIVVVTLRSCGCDVCTCEISERAGGVTRAKE